MSAAMNRGKTVDIGVQSFEKIRARNSFYVDKTDLIREWRLTWQTDTG